jgi:hypothetical protein
MLSVFDALDQLRAMKPGFGGSELPALADFVRKMVQTWPTGRPGVPSLGNADLSVQGVGAIVLAFPGPPCRMNFVVDSPTHARVESVDNTGVLSSTEFAVPDGNPVTMAKEGADLLARLASERRSRSEMPG